VKDLARSFGDADRQPALARQIVQVMSFATIGQTALIFSEVAFVLCWYDRIAFEMTEAVPNR
jgi:hypothetical protein